MEKVKLNPLALGYTAAIILAACHLLLCLFGSYAMKGAGFMIQQGYKASSFGAGGVVLGVIKAAIIGFVFAYVFGWLYNKIDFKLEHRK